jgi:hypothetical protein
VGTDRTKIIAEARRRLDQGFVRLESHPPLWDGHAAERIVSAILARMGHGIFVGEGG